MSFTVKIFNRDGSLFGTEHRPTKEYLDQSIQFWKHAGKRIEVTGKANKINILDDEAFERLVGLKTRIKIKTGLSKW